MILSLEDLVEHLTLSKAEEGLGLDVSSDSEDGAKQIFCREDGESRLHRLQAVEQDEDGDLIFVFTS